ncbi:hypothetical protein ABK040_007521 [Willaertia magna]
MTSVDEGAHNIQVVCRFRPQNELERQHDPREVIEINGESCKIHTKVGKHDFIFDHIFPSNCKQLDVFERVGKPAVEDIFKGYNGTIFVYGQTGSGKTFTMSGPNNELKGYCDDSNLKGIIPRIVDLLFENVEKSETDIEFTIQISYIEIYLEKIRDLLDPTQVNLKIKEDRDSGKGIYVQGATEEYVTSAEEVFTLMRQGARNRVVSATRMNEESSRSHSIFIITLNQKHLVNLESKSGKLFLVDLAGSEKVKKTGASGQTLEEAKNINKSLSCLGMVINALTDGVSKYIPYRDSKLTRLLQDSLGGNSRTTLIINCSSAGYNEDETLSTLRFGMRAKSIKNKPKVNIELSAQELQRLLDKAKEEIKELKNYVAALEEELKVFKQEGLPQRNRRSSTSSKEGAFFEEKDEQQEATASQEPENKETDSQETQPSKGNLENQLNELLPTVAKYRERCLELEKKLENSTDEKGKAEKRLTKLKERIHKLKERKLRSKEELKEMKKQLSLKTEYVNEVESYRNDLQKMIMLKTNEVSGLEEAIKEEKRKSEFLLKEKETEIDVLRAQYENFSKQLNETRVQLYQLQTKYDDPSVDEVLDFVNKRYLKARKLHKKAKTEEQSTKRKLAVETLKKIKSELRHLRDIGEDESEEESDSEEEIVEEMESDDDQQVEEPIIQQPTVQGNISTFTKPIIPLLRLPRSQEILEEDYYEAPMISVIESDGFEDIKDEEIKVEQINVNTEESKISKDDTQVKVNDVQEAKNTKVDDENVQEIDKLKQTISQLQQDLKIAEEARVAEKKEMEEQKKSLMYDLANRVDKVIELEIALDNTVDRYERLLAQNGNGIVATYQQKIGYLEGKLNQVSMVSEQIYSENNNLKSQLTVLEKILKVRDERIANLTNSIKEVIEKNTAQSNKYVQEITKLNESLRSQKYEIEKLKSASINQTSITISSSNEDFSDGSINEDGSLISPRSRIRKPVRGGGNTHIYKRKSLTEDLFSPPSTSTTSSTAPSSVQESITPITYKTSELDVSSTMDFDYEQSLKDAFDSRKQNVYANATLRLPKEKVKSKTFSFRDLFNFGRFSSSDSNNNQ